MPVSPPPILSAIVLVSGFGAVVMCLLVLRYGFSVPPEEPGEGRRRQMVTRLGHAVAGACFATAAILAVVLVSHARPQPGGGLHRAALEPDGTADILDTRVADVAARLAVLESRMDAMESRVAPLDGRVAETRDRLGAMAARLERAAVESHVEEIEARLGPVERRLERTKTVTPAAARLERAEARVSAIESVLRQHTDDMARAAARLRHLEEQQISVPSRSAPTSVIGPEKPRTEPTPASPRWVPAGDSVAPRSTPVPTQRPPASPPLRAASAPPPRAASPARESAVTPHAVPVAPPSSPSRTTSPAPAPDGEVRKGSTPSQDEAPGSPLAERVRGDWRTVRRGFSDAGEDFKRALDSLRHNFREIFGR